MMSEEDALKIFNLLVLLFDIGALVLIASRFVTVLQLHRDLSDAGAYLNQQYGWTSFEELWRALQLTPRQLSWKLRRMHREGLVRVRQIDQEDYYYLPIDILLAVAPGTLQYRC